MHENQALYEVRKIFHHNNKVISKLFKWWIKKKLKFNYNNAYRFKNENKRNKTEIRNKATKLGYEIPQ